jgi:hypothetical protein
MSGTKTGISEGDENAFISLAAKQTMDKDNDDGKD